MGKLKGCGMPPLLRSGASRIHAPADPVDARRSQGRPIKTAAWQRARSEFIGAAVRAAAVRGDVLRCAQTGVPLVGRHPADNSPVVDHIEPDRGDLELFWDRGNWQIVSKSWHDKRKQSLEKRGAV